MPESNEDKKIKDRSEANLEDLRRRILGYTFGGAPLEWCEGDNNHQGIRLPINPSEPQNSSRPYFRGCKKYQTCNLIPDELRWKSWDEMTDDQKEELRAVGCYRASLSDAWDITVLPSRQNALSKGEWIGNPFGLRRPEVVQKITSFTSENADRLHRDMTPCAIGGCITPEMQRTFEWQRISEHSPKVSLCQSIACPFYYRHTDDTLSHAVTNPLRFAQCYVTSPPFRQLLQDNGIVVVAPVHRSPEGRNAPGESYWYPFYAGYTFLQIPSRSPTEENFPDNSLTARWLLTRLERENLPRAFRRLPIRAVFEAAERGFQTTVWERDLGMISVSEGQASFFLLQWLLCQRFLGVLPKTEPAMTVDLTSELEWNYTSRGEQFGERLSDIKSLGFDLRDLFGLTETPDGEYVRYASLWQDLQLLGLVDENNEPTRRFECILRWLRSRIAWTKEPALNKHPDSLDEVITSRLEPLVEDAQLICDAIDDERLAWLLPRFIGLLISVISGNYLHFPIMQTDWDSLKEINIRNPDALATKIRQYLSSQDGETLFSMCRLLPAMHIMVRSNWSMPLRWLFVPLNITADVAQEPRHSNQKDVTRISSGLIIMLEDDLESLPYFVPQEFPNAGVKHGDSVMERLKRTLPYLSSAAEAELACLQDDIIQAYREWEMQEPRFAQVVHFLREVAQDLQKLEGDDVESIRRIVNILAQQFFIRPGRTSVPNRSVFVGVDAVKAAKDAVETFNEYYVRHYDCRAVLNLSAWGNSLPYVDITPYEQQHDGEPKDRLTKQGYYSLVFILLDLLAQRAPYAEGKTLTLALCNDRSGELTFEVQIPAELKLDWEFPGDNLSRFSGRRGFYNLFANAIALGCKYAAILSSTDNRPALLHISFQRSAK